MKAPVKMVIPIGIFIFPSVFIIIIAPALITITNARRSEQRPATRRAALRLRRRRQPDLAANQRKVGRARPLLESAAPRGCSSVG